VITDIQSHLNIAGGNKGEFQIGKTSKMRISDLFKTRFEIVAIAASAGGLSALQRVLSGLPSDFPAPILVVQHLDPRHHSLLADILNKRIKLAVKEVEHGEKLEPGTVYTAKPDRHMLVNPDGTVFLTQSELVHFVRPSADLLFESVAASYKERAIAVVLTGNGRDGSMGVKAIKITGGTVIAQDEATSEFYSMPAAATATGQVDFVLPLEDISAALMTMAEQGGRWWVEGMGARASERPYSIGKTTSVTFSDGSDTCPGSVM